MPPAAKLHEGVLRDRLEQIARATARSPGAVEALEALARSPDEFAPHRVNPLRFARERGLAEAEAIDLFLVAAKQGLFAMHWDVLCTGCGDLVERYDSLSFMHASYRCNICQYEYDTTLDASIEVSFTLSPAVRDLASAHPDRLSAEDYYFRWLLNPDGLVEGGRPYPDYIRPLVKVVEWLEPGARVTAACPVGEGVLTGFDGVQKTGFWVEVKGEPATVPQPLSFTLTDAGTYTCSAGELRPGPVALTFANPTARRGSVFLFNTGPGAPQHPTGYAPYLSAKRLFATPLFRDLFRGEVLGGTTGIKALDMTFLFTDLTGSTALYERIGDVKAYALVHEHFDALAGIIAAHGGAVVKTIGDAVMANFTSAPDGVNAAVAMQAAVGRINAARGGRDLLLKIGGHRGPCLAVTSNDRLDFFGQTVNLASRVQALAGPGEICLTPEILDADGARAALSAYHLKDERADVRGLAAPVPVIRATPREGTVTPVAGVR